MHKYDDEKFLVHPDGRLAMQSGGSKEQPWRARAKPEHDVPGDIIYSTSAALERQGFYPPQTPLSNCVFCEIVHGNSYADVVSIGESTIGIVPLKPVTEGHVIFMPKRHLRDAFEDTGATARVMQAACDYAGAQRSKTGLSYNVITSIGHAATQSIFHLHIHVVPRQAEDGLALPWHSGKGNDYV